MEIQAKIDAVEDTAKKTLLQTAFDALIALEKMEEGDEKRVKAKELKVIMRESGLDVIIRAFMCEKK